MPEKIKRTRKAAAPASRKKRSTVSDRRTQPPAAARRPRRPGLEGRQPLRDSDRTTAQILEAAVAMIESEGESGVRVHQLARKAGKTMGAVYHHFESREGLIERARAMQFRGRMVEDITAIDAILDRCTTPEETVDALTEITRALVAPNRRDTRWIRVDVVGSARARPKLAEVLGAEQRLIAELCVVPLRKARDRGLLRSDLDPEAMALFAQQMGFGFVLADIDPASGVDGDRYSNFIRMLLGGLLPEGGNRVARRKSRT